MQIPEVFFSFLSRLRFLSNILIIALSYHCLFYYAEYAIAEVTEQDSVPDVKLGEEYTDFEKTAVQKKKAKQGMLRKTLLYLPNRFLDLIDVFHFDAGVGPSFGAVVRVSKYLQGGFRSVSPFSLRFGLNGRHSPIFLESSSEFGISPLFVQSADRRISRLELGAGVDLFACGVYFGLDLESAGDFFLGIFGVDLAEDDF